MLSTNIKNSIKNKKILITGVGGTIGSALLRRLLDDELADSIIGIDINESALFNHQEKVGLKSKLLIADIRDSETMQHYCRGVDIVFHLAAYKHVYLCEESPVEAIKTNILATQNIINACNLMGVEKMIFSSSDKAVNPSNILGTSKLLAEKLISSTTINQEFKCSKTIFTSLRFGNVLRSSNSVLEVFEDQVMKREVLTVTDPDMTRFVMTIDDAVNMLLMAVNNEDSGVILVKKMNAINIYDLAEAVLEENGLDSKNIKITGKRRGEKLYEELMTSEEADLALEDDDFYKLGTTNDMLSINNKSQAEILVKSNSSKIKKLTKIQVKDLYKKIYQI